MQGEVQYEAHRLGSPERIYFDLHDTALAPGMFGRTIEIGDARLARVRIAQPTKGVSRVVLETTGASDFSVSMQSNPYRLVVEIRKAGNSSEHSAVADLPKSTSWKRNRLCCRRLRLVHEQTRWTSCGAGASFPLAHDTRTGGFLSGPLAAEGAQIPSAVSGSSSTRATPAGATAACPSSSCSWNESKASAAEPVAFPRKWTWASQRRRYAPMITGFSDLHDQPVGIRLHADREIRSAGGSRPPD